MNLLQLPHIDAPLMPAPDGLADIDAVQNRGRKGLYANALLRENALALLFEEAPVIFDHQVFGRIRTDAGPIQLTGPLPWEFLFLARFQSVRPQLLLGARQTAPQANAARVQPNLVSPNVRGRQSGHGVLRWVPVGGFPDFPRVIVISNPAGCSGQIKNAGRKFL